MPLTVKEDIQRRCIFAERLFLSFTARLCIGSSRSSFQVRPLKGTRRPRRKRNTRKERVDAAATVDNKDDCGLVRERAQGKKGEGEIESVEINKKRCPIAAITMRYSSTSRLLIHAPQPSNYSKLSFTAVLFLVDRSVS